MAGGQGTRISNPEKSLISIGKKSILESVIDSLSSLGFSTFVSTTGNHANVARLATKKGSGIIYTSGSGYEYDLCQSIAWLNVVPVLVLPADFISSDRLLFQRVWDKGAGSKHGVVTFTINRGLCGITVFNRIPVGGEALDYESVNIESGASFNINTLSDLEQANRHFPSL